MEEIYYRLVHNMTLAECALCNFALDYITPHAS